MTNYNNDISQELLEAIERYINGTMSLKERKDFDDYLKIDSNFRTQVEDIKAMLSGIETQSLKEELDHFHKEIDKQKNKIENHNKIQFVKLSKIAAAIAAVVAIASIWFFSSSPNEKLYTEYFIPDPGLPTTTGNTNNYNFYNAMVSYKHGDYYSAISEWQILNETDPKNDTLNYFLGLAHMGNNNIVEAIPYLERVVVSQDSFPLLSEAFLYLGLAYLKEGNTELAKKHLTTSNTKTSKNIISEITD